MKSRFNRYWGLDPRRGGLAGSGEQGDVPQLGAVAFAVVSALRQLGIVTRDGAADFEQPAFAEVSPGTECPVSPVRSDSR